MGFSSEYDQEQITLIRQTLKSILWRVVIWSKKAGKLYFHMSIVRGNKRQVNDFYGGQIPAELVNDDTIVLKYEYNGMRKGVHMANVAVLTDSCASISDDLLGI